MGSTDENVPDELSAAIEQFEHDSDLLVEDLGKEIDACRRPPFLYHYTDDASLKGILESGTIRITDIFRQNDPSELRHGLDLAIDALSSKARNGDHPAHDFSRGFESFSRSKRFEETAYYFICCLSSNGDDLGQWRAYGNNGQGFALGFEAAGLEDAFQATNIPKIRASSSFSIIYDDDRLKRILTQLADLVLPVAALSGRLPQGSESWREFLARLSTKHSVNVIRVMMLFKHEAYKNESEYRFLQVIPVNKKPDDIKYLTKPLVLKGYREFNWRTPGKKVLRKIVIGPAADKDKARRFVEDCLKAYHVSSENVEISTSVIPYRV